MRVKWGNKNESVTFEVQGTGAEKHDEILFLSILEKQACDREILQMVVRARIAEAQHKMHEKCEELARLKEKTILGRIKKFIFSPGGLIMKGI